MKRFLLLFALFFAYWNTSFAQTYVPFPTQEATWNFCSLNAWFASPLKISLTDTTSFRNQSYHQILLTYEGSEEEETLGGIREINKKVYFYHPNSEQEYLIFDFDITVGDTLTIYDGLSFFHPLFIATQPQPTTIQVEAQDSILIVDSYRKRWELTYLEGESLLQGNRAYWVEGIGFYFDELLFGQEAISVDGGYIIQFVCFYESERMHIIVPDPVCTSMLDGLPPPLSVEDHVPSNNCSLTIYTNKQESFLSKPIPCQQAIQQLVIFDGTGRTLQIRDMQAQQQEVWLNMENTQAGIYIYQLQLANGSRVSGQFLVTSDNRY